MLAAELRSGQAGMQQRGLSPWASRCLDKGQLSQPLGTSGQSQLCREAPPAEGGGQGMKGRRGEVGEEGGVCPRWLRGAF